MAWNNEVAICNGAVVLLGGSRIAALTDDSTEGLLCNQFYAQARDAVLADYPWNFATRWIDLGSPLGASDADYPVSSLPYTYGFPLPSTDYYCLRVLETQNAEPYKVQGRTLYTDSSSLVIRMIWRNTAVEQYQPMCALAISAYLAMLMAPTLTKSGTMFDKMEKLYGTLLMRAEDTDTQEGTPDEIDSDEVLNVRAGTGY